MTTPQSLSELIKNKTFCSMAWIHQFMDPTGRVKPCCRFEEKQRPQENNLNTESLETIFNGEWMQEVRRKMLSGEPVAGCTRCYQEEAAGKQSLRQRYHANLDIPIEKLVEINQPKIRWLELAISNNCNLACRMCDSRYSWKWFEEEKELFGTTYSPDKVSKIDISQLFPLLPEIVHLKFTGGEPLMTPEHWILLKKLTEVKDCSDVILNYSTNCTITPLPSWIELWSRFKRVEFALSFDSVNKHEAEYIRWPAKYEKIESTAKTFFQMSLTPQYRLILRTTVSILNVWSLPETILWWLTNNSAYHDKINPTHLTHPPFLSVTLLPKHLKDKVSSKFDMFIAEHKHDELKKFLTYIKKYMYSRDDSHMLSHLETYLKKTDSYRHQNFFNTYTQFQDIFKT